MTLEQDLQFAVDSSHSRTWRTFEAVRAAPQAYGLTHAKVQKWKTPGEPAFVSSLLDGVVISHWLPFVLGRHLGPLGLSNGEPLVSGVFMHQKPKVKFSRCHVELADLLFVRHHFTVGNGPAGVQSRAFLLQAKAGATPSSGTLAGKEAEQFRLYSNWKTPLSFPNGELGKPADGSSKWNLGQGPMAHSQHSGVYGLVFNGRPGAQQGFPSSCAWASGLAVKGQKLVTGTVSFADHLSRFMTGSAGRPWELSPTADDHWSQFVERCLEKAAGWTYPVQRLGATKQPRLQQALAFVSAFETVQQASGQDAGILDMQSMISRRLNWRHQFPDDFSMPPDMPRFPEVTLPRDGGISVVYTATFGPNPLKEVSPMDGELPD